MKRFYSGKFRPKNIGKYEGDYNNIVYRSLWERQLLKFLDENSSVISYSSEETIIPYRCATDNKMHRYFVDFKIKFANGDIYLIEVKPKAQTLEPKKKTKTTQRYINEVMTYAKNQSKWNAATALCRSRGWTFAVWTEETLQGLGIRLLTAAKPPKKRKML